MRLLMLNTNSSIPGIESNAADGVNVAGQAFFYLVQYHDGIDSTYGTESAAKPREPGPGDCE